MAFSSTWRLESASAEPELMATQSRAKRVASTIRTMRSTENPAACQVTGDESRSRHVMLDFSFIADLPGGWAGAFAAVWEQAGLRLKAWRPARARTELEAAKRQDAVRHDARPQGAAKRQ